jgi:DNA-binding transcriptional LysR family regulator
MGKSLSQNQWQFLKNKKQYHATVSGKYATTSMHLIIASAINGLGIAYVPIALVKEHIEAGRLVPVLTDYETPKSNMFLIYQSHKYMTKPIRLFIDHVIDKVTPNAPWTI